MGHRALVAYERTDEQYTLHYSHWGAANLKLTNTQLGSVNQRILCPALPLERITAGTNRHGGTSAGDVAWSADISVVRSVTPIARKAKA